MNPEAGNFPFPGTSAGRIASMKTIILPCATACALLGALPAGANMQSNRWFSEVTQDGRDVHFTIQLIEEDPPNFDTTFKLTRWDKLFFEHRQFTREEADEVVGPGCIEVNMFDGEPDAGLPDCDSDGAGDCAGICGTAYRYEFVDECVPHDHVMYTLWDESTFDENGNPPATGPESEGYWQTVDIGSGDDPCLDNGCSASPGIGRASEAGLAAFLLLVGLGAAAFARRRRAG